MILETGYIFKVAVAIGTFERGAVRGTGGIGQTKRATMWASGTVFFDISVSNITIITMILILGHSGDRKYSIVMLIIQ
jgi:hypothetical protein